MTAKERILQALATLPDDTTVEDAMERLYLLAKIERGIAQADAGETVSSEEVWARLAQALEPDPVAEKTYRLPFVRHEPSDDTDGRYLLEIPLLPGCRAWGVTAADALANLQSVAVAYILSCRDDGDRLPTKVEARVIDAGDLAEVIVTV